jgi:hypothetical protein
MTLTMKTRYRYSIQADLKTDDFRIIDNYFGLPCGLPVEAGGEPVVLRFERHGLAQAWLNLCAENGLPMTYTEAPTTDYIAANQTPLVADQVKPGMYVYDERAGQWRVVIGKSRQPVAVFLFVEGLRDALRFGFDEVVQVCMPLTVHRGDRQE